MTFDEQLNAYIERLGCTAKELAEASGLSAPVISRYRSGSRLPDADTDSLRSLACGIAHLAREKGVEALSEETVLQTLSEALGRSDFPFDRLRENFNALLSALSVNVSDLSRHLNYDTSYISRIRNGQRRPGDPGKFATEVARYVARKYTDEKDLNAIAHLIGCDAGELDNHGACLDKLVSWLTSGGAQKDLILPFLNKVDEFNLNDFIRSIRFDKLRVPTVPFQLPTSKHYYGLAEMRQAEIEFFKTVILSKSQEPLIMMDDTPMADKAEGTDFKKKFIFAVALALKKGMHIRMIHNLNRPFEEMMMGLEGWVPMYMTGQIAPYYLKGVHNAVFGHLLFSGGTAALEGECIMGHHENGKMYLTNNKTEAAYYRRRAEDLLDKASPLMEIYRSDAERLFRSFLQTEAETPGSRRSILSAPPLFTISGELLEQMLGRTDLTEKEREKVCAYVLLQRNRMETLLKNNTVSDEFPLVSREEFEAYPMSLSLAGLFLEKDIPYTYEEYLLHIEQTKAYAEGHPHYHASGSGSHMFRNIQIRILEGKWAVISKNKAPVIHFVIRHPKLLEAIENFASLSGVQEE